jgi:hypothetical protein
VYATQDILDTDADVFSYFTQMDLLEMAECTTLKEAEEMLGILGYDDFFSFNDVLQIRDLADTLARAIYGMK